MATRTPKPADEQPISPATPTAPPAPPTAPPAPPATPPAPAEPKPASSAVSAASEPPVYDEPGYDESAARADMANGAVTEVIVDDADDTETVVVETDQATTTVMPSAPTAPTVVAPVPPTYATGPVYSTGPVASPYYPAAPEPAGPVLRGNRGFGLLMGLIATIVFAGVFLLAAAAYDVIAQYGEGDFGAAVTAFLPNPAFWVPVIVFFVVFELIALIGGAVGWWYWVLLSFVLGVAVYFGAAVGLMGDEYGLFSIDWAAVYVNTYSYLLFGPVLLAFVIARETTVWFGAAIAKRGRRIAAENAAAREEYRASIEAPARV